MSKPGVWDLLQLGQDDAWEHRRGMWDEHDGDSGDGGSKGRGASLQLLQAGAQQHQSESGQILIDR